MINSFKTLLIYASVAASFVAAGIAFADWDANSFFEVETQYYHKKIQDGWGCVWPYQRDIVTDLVGDRVYVHMLYTSCPTEPGGGESYDIKYRRGSYDVALGPGQFSWDNGFENEGQIISGPLPGQGRFKMQPTLAITPTHRLYAFWTDSSQCDESSGLWDNMEIYGQTAPMSPMPPPSWSWLDAPRRVSVGPWYSDVPAVAFDAEDPPNAQIFWRDGREAPSAAERTDIFAEDWNEDTEHFPEGGWRLSQNGGLALFGEYNVLDARLDAAADPWGNIHLVWADKRPGDAYWQIYYKRRAANGMWSADVRLSAAAGVTPTKHEKTPQVVVINLAGTPMPAQDLCVMVSSGESLKPVMYIYDAAAASWTYLTNTQVNFGQGWTGAVTAEGINNVIHVLDKGPKDPTTKIADLLYHRGRVTTSGVSWDRQNIVVQPGGTVCKFPSLYLDAEGVLHAFYWRHYSGTYPQISSVYYENDGGTNYVGP